MRLSFGTLHWSAAFSFVIVCSLTELNDFYSYYKTNGHSLTPVLHRPNIATSLLYIPQGKCCKCNTYIIWPILYGLRGKGQTNACARHTDTQTHRAEGVATQPCLGGLLKLLLWFIVLVTLYYGFFRTGVSKLGPAEFSSNPNQTHLNQLIKVYAY